ncbi:uncharacterized protein LOC132572647 [Heteronotia binoei]|uniref:uncharacterized protein LOC132572647 n=1 Tax=Heteronotia binoei TaxID=13085 RepID=UPI002931EE4E|nr:uncharacterized protein LOC132572647 [Heteronotia binoei]
MFWHHGTNVTLVYEPPMSVSSMSFLPTPFQAPEIVLAQLQNLNRSYMFTNPLEDDVNATRFRMFHYQYALPGLCFCCGATNNAFSKWKGLADGNKHWLSRKNQTHCSDRFWVGGGNNMNCNSSYNVNISLMNSTWDMLHVTFPFLFPNVSTFTPGSICSGWIIKDPNLWFFWGTGRAAAASFTGILTLGGYSNIVAQENRASIIGLTCRLEQSINATTSIIRDLQKEIFSLHQIQLQHRLALDYLLARQGGFCKIVGPAACEVRFQDFNRTIEEELKHLHNLIADNALRPDWDPFAWLTSLLPDPTWLRQLICAIIVIVVLLIIACCCIQCLPNLLQLCTRSKETWQRRALYYAYHQLKNKKGEM